MANRRNHLEVRSERVGVELDRSELETPRSRVAVALNFGIGKDVVLRRLAEHARRVLDATSLVIVLVRQADFALSIHNPDAALAGEGTTTGNDVKHIDFGKNW